MNADILIVGAFPFIFVLVSIIIEALMLFQLKWTNLKDSFRDSVLANLASTIVIALLSPLILGVGNVFLALLVALSVASLVEGLVFLGLRRRPAVPSFRAALLANLSSFVFAYSYVFTFILI